MGANSGSVPSITRPGREPGRGEGYSHLWVRATASVVGRARAAVVGGQRRSKSLGDGSVRGRRSGTGWPTPEAGHPHGGPCHGHARTRPSRRVLTEWYDPRPEARRPPAGTREPMASGTVCTRPSLRGNDTAAGPGALAGTERRARRVFQGRHPLSRSSGFRRADRRRHRCVLGLRRLCQPAVDGWIRAGRDRAGAGSQVPRPPTPPRRQRQPRRASGRPQAAARARPWWLRDPELPGTQPLPWGSGQAAPTMARSASPSP